MVSYEEFLATKQRIHADSGRRVADSDVNPILFPFQRDLVRWALRKGRAAIFADCGLGKTFMQLEWARLTGERTLILAPLAVARQTRREGEKIGLEVHETRDGADLSPGINVTNYEMLLHFDPTVFGAVVLDESSILKSQDGKTRALLIEAFASTPWRLCCTATPAPNDVTELAQHAEFLGVCSRGEMLARYFVSSHHKGGAGGEWRLKGHAHEAFGRWLASWGMFVRFPSDLGYDDDGFLLPALSIEERIVSSADCTVAGTLFPAYGGLGGVQGRTAVRRGTLEARVTEAARLVNGEGQWVAWVGLNDEGRQLAKRVPDCVLSEGSDSPEEKALAIEDFVAGRTRVLITKPGIHGFGVNLQNCHQQVFVGIGDSYEAYYQCIRRCWRFGQTEPVITHIIVSDAETAIVANVRAKEVVAKKTAADTLAHVADAMRKEMREEKMREDYHPTVPFNTPDWLPPEVGEVYVIDRARGEDYAIYNGDSCEVMPALPDECMDLSVFSPPFMALYTYTPSIRDLGNCHDYAEFWSHFDAIPRELLRITRPGRLACVHFQQIMATMNSNGFNGFSDFRGPLIGAFTEAGWNLHGEVKIDRNPQGVAVRLKLHSLLFKTLEHDSCRLSPALGDNIIIFRKPGENAVPVQPLEHDPPMTREDWITWAHPVWYGLRETNTLQTAEGCAEEDERHVCPLPLDITERCVRLYSNPGEVVFTPFLGIGSEVYEALRWGRRGVGIELKESYFRAAARNCQRALGQRKQMKLDLA